MKPSSIGQRTKCVTPKPPLCRRSMLSNEGNNVRGAPLVRPMIDERERQDATPASIHSTPSDRQDLSLPAWQCIPAVPGCIYAFSIHITVCSFADDHRTPGEYSPRHA